MQKVLARHGFSAHDWHELGLARLDDRDLAGARRCFVAALAMERRFAVCWYNLAWVQDELGELAEAADSLRQALTIIPWYVDAKMNLARVLMRLARQPGK